MNSTNKLLLLALFFQLAQFLQLACAVNATAQLPDQPKRDSLPAVSEADKLAAQKSAQQLWNAARTGDLQQINQLLDAGVDVNSATHYNSTALIFACDRGHVEAVKLLLKRGANPNVQDTFYKASPLDWAMMNGHHQAITEVLAAGANGADRILLESVGNGDKKLAEAVIQSGKASESSLAEALRIAEIMKQGELLPLFADLKFERLPQYPASVDQLKLFVGKYSAKDFPGVLSVEIDEGKLKLEFSGQSRSFVPLRENLFVQGSTRIEFKSDAGKVVELIQSSGGNSVSFKPANQSEPTAADKTANNSATSTNNNDAKQEDSGLSTPFEPGPQDALVSSKNWPGFRGTGSRGVADGQHPPIRWDIQDAASVAWKIDIPGLGNSCPVIWGDKLFITTAASEHGDKDVRIGLYGNVESVEDDSQYEFIVLCLNKQNGKEIWRRVAHTGKPAIKRHSKSSHANPTVATDGKHVVAFFGSEGLYCYDLDGKLLWRRELGVLDSGWFFNADYQWGFGSSPVIAEDRVFVQCDIQAGSFVAALDIATGAEVWRTAREEIPTWSTPVYHQFGDVPMLITHGTRAARAYDARDGKLLWSLADHSEIVVPTPFVAHDLIYLTSGYSPIQPVVAVRPSARGQMRLPNRSDKSDSSDNSSSSSNGIAWSHTRGGTYMPTPVAYGELLYTCANNGVVTCYRATTGEQVYRKRLPGSGTLAFTGSPIAADGQIYFPAEDGQVYVVRAGEPFSLTATNPSGGKVMTTPAISDGLFFLRTTDGLIAFKNVDR